MGNISSVLFSTTAENQTDKRSPEIAARVASLILWFNVALGLLLAAIAYPLVRFLYGSDYQFASTLILWLLPGIVTLGFGKVTANYLAGIGRPGINAAGSMAGVVINIVANVLMIPHYGLIGAAGATSLSYTAIALYSYFCFLFVGKTAWHAPLIPRQRDIAMVYSYVRQLIRFSSRNSSPEQGKAAE